MKKAILLEFGAELTKEMLQFSYASLVLLGLAIRINKGVTLEEDRRELSNVNPSNRDSGA